MSTDEKCDIIIAMLDEQKASGKNQKGQQLDFSKIELLSEQLEGIVAEVRKPIVSQRRFTIDIASKGTFFAFIGMLVIISGLSAWLYLTTRPNYARIDNDIKYRYIKMKGCVSAQGIIDLENLFEVNRDNTKIRQMNKDVEDYERAVNQRVAIEEQALRKALEAEKLDKEANSIKNK